MKYIGILTTLIIYCIVIAERRSIKIFWNIEKNMKNKRIGFSLVFALIGLIMLVVDLVRVFQALIEHSFEDNFLSLVGGIGLVLFICGVFVAANFMLSDMLSNKKQIRK